MSNTTITPNMGLIVPTVGVDPGPDWATNLNASLSILDSHNHSPGQGVQITPSGLDINSDLQFLGNNATLLRSVRFQPQSSPLSGITDIGCLYESGVDLYYNDGSGNQVRITQSGGVAGTSGSIGGLVSPASATYVSADQTFVWQSNANTPANMDAASYIFRNLVANSHGLTLNPPNAMPADYSLTLPSLPSQTSFMTLDTSGNMAATLPFQGGIGPAQLSAFNYLLTASTGSFSGTTGLNQFPNLSGSITISGSRPVMVRLQDNNGSTAMQWITSSGSMSFYRDGIQISYSAISSNSTSLAVPPSAYSFVDISPSAGAHTYAAYYTLPGGDFLNVTDGIRLLVYEM
jgi:hypothetical protein